jgi:hypothetical protein
VKCDNDQDRAQQQKAGHNYRQESIGHEVMITHGAPAAIDAASDIKDFGIGLFVGLFVGAEQSILINQVISIR